MVLGSSGTNQVGGGRHGSSGTTQVGGGQHGSSGTNQVGGGRHGSGGTDQTVLVRFEYVFGPLARNAFVPWRQDGPIRRLGYAN